MRDYWRRAAFTLLAAAALAGCGGSGHEKELRTLREDPLGRYVPPGGRLVRTDAAERSGGGLFGKPTPASYRRLFAVTDGQSALDAAVAAAQASGWSVDKPIPGLGVSGRKQLADGSATMSASLLTDPAAIPGDTPPPVLSLALEHSRS